MKKLAVVLVPSLFFLSASLRTAQLPDGPDTRLILLVAVDQFRYDYLTRFRSEYTDGIKRLLTNGAVFTNANLEHYPTVTAIGHATMLTGATPSVSGIIGNDWFDRETGAIGHECVGSTQSSRLVRRRGPRHLRADSWSARWATN